MTAALYLLGALLAAALILKLTDRHRPGTPDVVEPEAGCCGRHQICERDSLLAAVSEKPEYFDDEDLDTFAGRQPHQYTPAESERFRDILLTLLPDDVAPWARSLQLRGIQLPADVRDELLLLVAENRNAR